MRNPAVPTLVLALATLSSCNSAPRSPEQPPRDWPVIAERKLNGVWTSDKYGRLIISCSGYVHYDDQGGFDLSNTGLKNARITEVREQELIIETMPLLTDHYPVPKWPYEESGTLKMRFWDRDWKRVEERPCSGS
jgi:hypothetical protein